MTTDEIKQVVKEVLVELGITAAPRDPYMMTAKQAAAYLGVKTSRLPTYSFIRCLKGEDILLNSNAVFDYLYVGDLCAIVSAFMENFPSQRLINATPTRSVQLLEIAHTARKISGARVGVSILSAKMGNSYTGDNTRLLEQLPNFKFTPLSEGMERLWRGLVA